MQGRCDNNPLDQAEDVCNECGGEYCSACLVYPRGQKRPPVCKACAILKSGVRMSGRNEKWESANRKGIRKRRKSVQAAAAAEPQEQLFRFFDEDGSDVEVRDRESLAGLADGIPTEEEAPKKTRRWRRKDDKPSGRSQDASGHDDSADDVTSLPVPDDAEEPVPTPIAAHADGVDVDDFLADDDKPKRGFGRRSEDHVEDAELAPTSASGTTSEAAEDESVDIGAALSMIDDGQADDDVAAPVDGAPSVDPQPSPPRSAPRATELLSKLREAGGEVAAVEPQPVEIPDDPWAAVATQKVEPEPDPFFEPSPPPTQDNPFEPAANSAPEPDPFTAEVDPFVPAEPLPAPIVDQTPHAPTPAAASEPDPFTVPTADPGVAAMDDPFAATGASVDPFQTEPIAAPAENSAPIASPFDDPATAQEQVVERAPMPSQIEPSPFDPASPSELDPTPADQPPSAPEPQVAARPSPTDPPAGAADRDADGNWIPPVLRGMAPVQERQALPKRRGG